MTGFTWGKKAIYRAKLPLLQNEEMLMAFRLPSHQLHPSHLYPTFLFPTSKNINISKDLDPSQDR